MTQCLKSLDLDPTLLYQKPYSKRSFKLFVTYSSTFKRFLVIFNLSPFVIEPLLIYLMKSFERTVKNA